MHDTKRTGRHNRVSAMERPEYSMILYVLPLDCLITGNDVEQGARLCSTTTVMLCSVDLAAISSATPTPNAFTGLNIKFSII